MASSLEAKLCELDSDLDYHTKIIKKLEAEKEILKNSKEVDIAVLASDLVNNTGKGVTFQTTTGKYRYILGGDGRSQPWDEQREGEILKVTISKNTYIADSTFKSFITMVKEYFSKVEAIFVDDKQVYPN